MSIEASGINVSKMRIKMQFWFDIQTNEFENAACNIVAIFRVVILKYIKGLLKLQNRLVLTVVYIYIAANANFGGIS